MTGHSAGVQCLRTGRLEAGAWASGAGGLFQKKAVKRETFQQTTNLVCRTLIELAFQRHDFLLLIDVPQLDRCIPASRSENLAVR